jgi:outer membrane protein TolC
VLRIIFFLLIATPLFAQTIETAPVFSLEKYLKWVRTYHPVMLQSNLLKGKADASLLEARGVFDPKWFGEYEDKSFDQKNYFRIGEAGLKIPTWWGVDVKMAYLWSNGDFLNSEGTLPKNGQAVLGLEVPLLQGLVFDQRRAQVRQAQLLEKGNEATRKVIVNELLLKAIEAYWVWAFQNQMLQVYENSLNLAEDRFQLVKSSFLQGDKPAIDTLESLIQIQNRKLQLSEVRVEFRNAALFLSNFLWFEDLTPVEVSEELRPESLEADWNFLEEKPSPEFLNSISETHPELQSILVKQQQLDIKERLKREQFKPNLRFNYNFLGSGFDLTDDASTQSDVNALVTENYKWGVQLSYPLLLRKERGGLELVKIEQLENQYKFGEKQLTIANKINAIYQQLEMVFGQTIILASMVVNYEVLLAAEFEMFDIGESSIFLINTREQKLIDSQMKLNKLQSEYQKLKWKLRSAKGLLL